MLLVSCLLERTLCGWNLPTLPIPKYPKQSRRPAEQALVLEYSIHDTNLQLLVSRIQEVQARGCDSVSWLVQSALVSYIDLSSAC